MMLVTCRCGATLAPHATSCGRCGARPVDDRTQARPAPVRPTLVRRAPTGHVAVPQPRLATTTARAPHFAPPPGDHYAPRPLWTPAPARVAMPIGAPATAVTPRAPWSLGVVLGASVLVVLLTATVAVLALRPTTVVAAPVPAVSEYTSETTTVTAAPAPTDTRSYGGYDGYGSDRSTDTDATSAQLLREGVESHRAAVERIVGQWVPQLSAKKAGTEADGVTYDSTAILSHYNGLKSRYPEARLLYSGDWPVFKGSDFWVVVAARPFTTAAAANAWCDTQGFGADDCMAKRLAHTGGPNGTTVPRS